MLIGPTTFSRAVLLPTLKSTHVFMPLKATALLINPDGPLVF